MESNLDIKKIQWYISYGKITFHRFRGEYPNMKNRLEELRKQMGVKQEELAETLQVSRQTIGSLEKGMCVLCLF